MRLPMIPQAHGALDDVRACEERLLNCWPSHQNVLMGDWACRFANGYSGRANSACTYRPGAQLAEEEIRAIEALYRHAGLRPSIRLSPLVQMETLQRLEDRGYAAEDASEGMIGPARPAPEDPALGLEASPSRGWLEGACRWQVASKRDPGKLLGIVGNIRVPSRFATLSHEGAPAGYAVISLDRGMAEFGAVIINPDLRGLGLGRRLVQGIIGWAQAVGAERVFLQVSSDNAPARQLYTSLGFRDTYSAAYWRPMK